MPHRLHESSPLGEAASSPSGRMRVTCITPGLGSSGYYSPQVLEQAATDRLIQRGTPVHFDHASESERLDRPERSVRDIAGVFTGDAAWDGSGLVGEVQVFAPYRELVTEMAPYIGLSLTGSATDVTEGEHGGRRVPVIEGLAAIDAVDLVTRAGRGGRIDQLLESARDQMYGPLSEATADDRSRQLSDAVRAAYATTDTYAWVSDVDVERQVVWFEVTPESGRPQTYEQAYQVADNDVEVTLAGERTPVARVTRYVPVNINPAGQPTTTQETQEVTMGNIQVDEAEHRRVTEAAGRVPTLEAERDTAVQERDEARRRLAESHAHQSAVTRARARVTTANTALAPATVDRIVAEATRAVPLISDGERAGQLDEAALDTAVDQARTAEEAYLATLTGSASNGTGLRGFGESGTVQEGSTQRPTRNAWGRSLTEKGA